MDTYILKKIISRKSVDKRNLKNNDNIEVYMNSYDIDSLKVNTKDYRVQIRLSMIDKYLKENSVTLDLCCGTGWYLERLATRSKRVYALDAVPKFLEEAKLRTAEYTNIDFITADARTFSSQIENKIDLLISFCSLYHIPEIDQVISSISKSLSIGGIAVLEFGNNRSLNGIISRVNFQNGVGAKLFGVAQKDIIKILTLHGLRLVEKRTFQLLNDYGVPRKLWFLLPFAGPYLKRILSQKVYDITLDELICKVPLLRNFSFRYILVCEKIV